MFCMSKSKKFLALAAFVSFAFAIYLWFMGDIESALFVGLWVPSILSLSNFFKN